MITKFEISAGKKESIRFDATEPIRYEPTSERWVTAVFADMVLMSFYTNTGNRFQNLELYKFENPNAVEQNILNRIEQIKEKLSNFNCSPTFTLNRKPITENEIPQS